MIATDDTPGDVQAGLIEVTSYFTLPGTKTELVFKLERKKESYNKEKNTYSELYLRFYTNPNPTSAEASTGSESPTMDGDGDGESPPMGGDMGEPKGGISDIDGFISMNLDDTTGVQSFTYAMTATESMGEEKYTSTTTIKAESNEKTGEGWALVKNERLVVVCWLFHIFFYRVN